MSDTPPTLEGDDFAQGIALERIADGALLLGHAHGEAVLLARRGDEVFAIGATCTHYGGPLAEGLLVGDTVRCPWHHAAFSLRTGEVERAPALGAVACWQVEQRDGKVFVAGKRIALPQSPAATRSVPESVVIVGGGAAGHAAAETLRREGYDGPVTVLSADAALPCDRPNLSKNYLAGTAPAEWLPLRPAEFYEEQRIEVRLNTQVTGIDTAQRQVQLAGGEQLPYGALLLATGAAPVRLDIPGADLPHVHCLRTQADGEALAKAASNAKRAVVVGASFIGLEVAASLRARGVEVQVVGRETELMAKVLGAQVGRFLQSLHEQHGVVFHLGREAARMDASTVTLDNGEVLEADLVVVGIGPASAFVWSTGWWLAARVRRPRATCWDSVSAAIWCRFSGPSNTTLRWPMWATPNALTRQSSTVTWARKTAPSHTGAMAASWRWRWCTATWKVCAQKWHLSVPWMPTSLPRRWHERASSLRSPAWPCAHQARLRAASARRWHTHPD